MKMISSRTLRLILTWTVALALFFPFSSAIAKRGGNCKTKVRVMTRNLYLGADIFKVIEAAFIVDGNGNIVPNPDPYAIPLAVADVFQTMIDTDFSERAEAIADEILATKPHVIGIQEASTYYIQTPGDFIFGNPVQADTVVIDFSTVLNAALEARGLHYDAYTVTNADIELPMFNPSSLTSLSDVRLVDHDMILVRKGIDSFEQVQGNYEKQLGLDVGGVPVEFTRGYLIVDVDIKGKTFRFVNTHLEVRSAPGSYNRVVQDSQMQNLLELVDLLSIDDPKPVIMVGDFNSSPDDVDGYYEPAPDVLVYYKPPYMRAIEAGYLDTWLLQKRYDEGYTSGFDEYVSDPGAELDTRIDLIFADPGGYTIEKVKADVVGDEIKDMTPNGLWPSDHAGVVANIKFSKKRKH